MEEMAEEVEHVFQKIQLNEPLQSASTPTTTSTSHAEIPISESFIIRKGEDKREKEEDVPHLLEINYSDVMTEQYESNDVRLAMIGNVDSGKSTLIGILTNSVLDDGRGGARSMVLRHRHEQENGRTSAVTIEIMGYKGSQQIIPTARNHAARWTEVMEKSDHSVTLIDLCGHEKYLKTTLFGLTGLVPDYCLLVVGSNMGVQVMTKEHISIACALNIPMIVIITKIDICPPNILQNTRKTLAKLLRANGKMPFPMKDESSVGIAVESIASNRITPVFAISAVNGAVLLFLFFLFLLILFLSLLFLNLLLLFLLPSFFSRFINVCLGC